MHISPVNNNKSVNFKANIILKDNPALKAVIEESFNSVGSTTFNKTLNQFKNFHPETPIKLHLNKKNVFGNEITELVATNLNNKERYKEPVNNDSSFIDLLLNLMNIRHNKESRNFWNKPSIQKEEKIDIFDHDIFVKTENFNIDEYNKTILKNEAKLSEIENRIYSKLIKILHNDPELRSLIYDIVQDQSPKPISKEKLQKYMEAYSKLTDALKGNDWIK